MKHACAICQSVGVEKTFPVEFTLQELGIEGTHAHISCLATMKEQHRPSAPMPPSAHTAHRRFFNRST